MLDPSEREEALVIEASGATDIGLVRTVNEDLVLLREDLSLYVVCDGAGGHEAGEVAASIAVRSIGLFLTETKPAVAPADFDAFGFAPDARRLATALHKANRDVHAVSQASAASRGMGTTVVGALFSPRSSQLHIAHVGDSRCYRFRAGHLEQLTQDHSVLRDVIEQRPDLADELLARLPKHAVTRALGMEPRLRVSIDSHEVVDGDRYLLCSDGLSSPVPASAIAQALERQGPPAEIVAALLDLTRAAGAPDNVAVIVIDCRGPRTSELPISVGAREASGLRAAMASEPEILLLGIEELRLDEIGTDDIEELSRKLDSLLQR